MNWIIYGTVRIFSTTVCQQAVTYYMGPSQYSVLKRGSSLLEHSQEVA